MTLRIRSGRYQADQANGGDGVDAPDVMPAPAVDEVGQGNGEAPGPDPVGGDGRMPVRLTEADARRLTEATGGCPSG